jgi:hypothetical protein
MKSDVWHESCVSGRELPAGIAVCKPKASPVELFGGQLWRGLWNFAPCNSQVASFPTELKRKLETFSSWRQRVLNGWNRVRTRRLTQTETDSAPVSQRSCGIAQGKLMIQNNQGGSQQQGGGEQRQGGGQQQGGGSAPAKQKQDPGHHQGGRRKASGSTPDQQNQDPSRRGGSPQGGEVVRRRAKISESSFA